MLFYFLRNIAVGKYVNDMIVCSRASIAMNLLGNQLRHCTSHTLIPATTDEEKQKELEKIAKDASIDEPPTACCRTGCANCVFIVWAEALSNKMEHAGPEITEKVLKMVDDPSMKAYLEMELRIRLKNKT